MMIEDFKKVINNSLKKIQENTGKQLEALKGETQKSLKELQGNTTKQVKELNKTIQDLKMEIETIKKSQREISLARENLGRRSGVTDTRITNRIQEIEERSSGAEDTIENIDTTVWLIPPESLCGITPGSSLWEEFGYGELWHGVTS
jgi:chromosome segregation ATPase